MTTWLNSLGSRRDYRGSAVSAAEPRAKKVPRPGTRILPALKLQGMDRLVPSGQLLVLAKQYREGKFDARNGVWELSTLGPLANMGTRLG